MLEHTIGSREDWQAARDELAKLEAEQAARDAEITKKRRELPWVPVEKEYEFDTEEGKKTLAELFDGRSQLLAYNIMFGPDYTLGACPGCTSLGDGLDGSLVHLDHWDVTLICGRSAALWCPAVPRRLRGARGRADHPPRRPGRARLAGVAGPRRPVRSRPGAIRAAVGDRGRSHRAAARCPARPRSRRRAQRERALRGASRGPGRGAGTVRRDHRPDLAWPHDQRLSGRAMSFPPSGHCPDGGALDSGCHTGAERPGPTGLRTATSPPPPGQAMEMNHPRVAEVNDDDNRDGVGEQPGRARCPFRRRAGRRVRRGGARCGRSARPNASTCSNRAASAVSGSMPRTGS